MIRFLKTLFRPENSKSEGPIEPDSIQYALWQRDFTTPSSVAFFIDCDENGLDPLRIEPLLTKDELKAAGLHARLKVSRQFYQSLKPRYRNDPREAARSIANRIMQVKYSRKTRGELLSLLGTDQRVKFNAYAEPSICKQARDFSRADHIVATMHDLPLPGCDADRCFCMYQPVIKF